MAIDEVSAQSMGDPATLSAWREIEVELNGGDPDLLEAIDKRLRGAGLSPAGHSAKLARALAGRLPETPAPAPLAPGSAARQVVLAYATDQVAEMQATHPRVRRDEPKSVHEMRVAARRLRSARRSGASGRAGRWPGPGRRSSSCTTSVLSGGGNSSGYCSCSHSKDSPTSVPSRSSCLAPSRPG